MTEHTHSPLLQASCLGNYTAHEETMRKVVQYTLTSIDGAFEDPRRYFPDSAVDVASPPVFDPVLLELENAMIATQDAVLLGRVTFDEWSGYWPTSNEQPYADFINGVTKHVVTSRPLATSWANAVGLGGPLETAVRELKDGAGGDIGVHGSISVARSLLAAGLVDELHLAVGPVLDPLGPRLFDGLRGLQRLELVRATPTPNGSVWLTYRSL